MDVNNNRHEYCPLLSPSPVLQLLAILKTLSPQKPQHLNKVLTQRRPNTRVTNTVTPTINGQVLQLSNAESHCKFLTPHIPGNLLKDACVHIYLEAGNY